MTFDTPCNLVRFPANEPLQCVSSVANIWLGSCKWSSCEASRNLRRCFSWLWRAQARSLHMGRISGPRACTVNQTNCDWKDLNGWRETFWGGEIQTHLPNLVDTTEILFQRQKYSTRPPIWIGKLLEAKRSLLWSPWKRRHTKFTYQRITSMLII